MEQTASHRTRNITEALRTFSQLPDEAIVRVGVVASLRACSIATVWRHSNLGILPKPRKISDRITGWRVGELRAVLGKPGESVA